MRERWPRLICPLKPGKSNALRRKMGKERVNQVYNCFQRVLIQSLKMLVGEQNGK